jgi:phosphoenolpyruvate carboxykinase (GTP)
MLDKAVWVKWMELRVHDDVDAIDAGYGLIPKYEDLQALFKQCLDKEYTQDDYVEQFMIRIPELLAKLDRMEEIYATVNDTPHEMKDEMDAQRKRLTELQQAKGNYISPLDL